MGPEGKDRDDRLPEEFEELDGIHFEIISPSGAGDAQDIFDEETYKILQDTLDRLGYEEGE